MGQYLQVIIITSLVHKAASFTSFLTTWVLTFPFFFFSPGIGPHLAEESSLFSLVLFSKVSQEVETWFIISFSLFHEGKKKLRVVFLPVN